VAGTVFYLLQWLGEVDLRFSMEGRLMLVHLMCKDVGGGGSGQDQNIFNPCVAFRVAGTPSESSLKHSRYPGIKLFIIFLSPLEERLKFITMASFPDNLISLPRLALITSE